LKEWTTLDSRNTPSTANLEEEETVDAPGNDGNASMPEQVKHPKPWRKMMTMTMIIIIIILVITFIQGIYNYIPETNHVSRVYSVAAALFEFDVCVAVHL
jgi:hypothetical protein